MHMLFHQLAEHKDVIKVESHAMHQVGDHQIHQPLKYFQCITQPYEDN